MPIFVVKGVYHVHSSHDPYIAHSPFSTPVARRQSRAHSCLTWAAPTQALATVDAHILHVPNLNAFLAPKRQSRLNAGYNP